jgi:hypothetical protein
LVPFVAVVNVSCSPFSFRKRVCAADIQFLQWSEY